MKNYCLFLIAIIALFLFSCEDETDKQTVAIQEPAPRFMNLEDLGISSQSAARTANSNKAIFSAEYITSGNTNDMGNIVYFNNRGNKQLGADFVPGQSLDGTNAVSYYVDNNRPSVDLAAAVTEAAIDRAMNTWDGVNCSDLGMTKIPYDGRATGFVAGIFGYGGSTDYAADVLHAGWLPAAFFNILTPGGGSFILGVTFTIIFTDENNNPIDTNNDGKADVAWREIYYNDEFPWQDGSTYDVETVALHEAGHGLSQAHFGKAFRTLANGKLHFSPRAVMNAAYSGVQTEIGKTDNGGHCSNWANWPNN